jgi:hypothetical protein
MRLTCPRCGAKGVTVGWLDCLSAATWVVPSRCDACGGTVKRRWFSWWSFVFGLPAFLGALPTLITFEFFPYQMVCLLIGVVTTSLLQGFCEPFYTWPKPIVVPPVIIPPEGDE